MLWPSEPKRAWLVGVAVAAACGSTAAGCGQLRSQQSAQRSSPVQTTPVSSSHAHPQVVQPVAGAAPASGASDAAPTSVSVGPPSGGSLPQPESLAQVRAELAASGLSGKVTQATLAPGGLAIAPTGAPAVVQQMINAGNQIAHLPYRFGGGHGTYQDTAYDCSGSLSFVFIEAGILNTTVDSSELMRMGKPGPGKWVTIYANPGHTFMYVAGLRFDTVALAASGSRWSNGPPEEGIGGFVVRHPPGL